MKKTPEIYKKYNVFDNGIISYNRIYSVYVVDVIPFSEIHDKILILWNYQKKECDWIYSQNTDFFIEARDKYNNMEIFVRTLDGGWFSIGDYLSCGELDVDGELIKKLN